MADGENNERTTTRVTLATLDGKLNLVLQRLDAVCSTVSEQGAEIKLERDWRVESQTRWKKHDEEHEELKRVITGIKRLDAGLSALIGLGAAIAGRFGQ
jgi:vacuolar-type H+-ATPase catalytic subunit A/Vma1